MQTVEQIYSVNLPIDSHSSLCQISKTFASVNKVTMKKINPAQLSNGTEIPKIKTINKIVIILP